MSAAVHRCRKRLVLAIAAALLGIGGGVLAYMWSASGSHEVLLSQAYKQFHGKSTTPDRPPQGVELVRPAQGVYRYSGGGTEHVSFPPKTQLEGPVIPGTVTYTKGGCWEFRLDYSDNHWQSTTYCLSPAGLLLTARAGWYRWDFVFTTVEDTASYRCSQSEVAVPSRPSHGERFGFSCRGTNNHLSIPAVTMSGYKEFIGTEPVVIGARRLMALHLREVARFSGGQSGTNVADTWFDPATDLPLRGTWSTRVRTASPVGTSTLTASGHFSLVSLTPHA